MVAGAGLRLGVRGGMPGRGVALPDRIAPVVGVTTGRGRISSLGKGDEQGVTVLFDGGGALPDGGVIPRIAPEGVGTSNLPPVPPAPT